jgi:6-phosphogluconolactonase (cycloisomerase 2 family)
VSGSVTGLNGSGLTLALNGGGNLAISGNGAFTFAGGLASGASYSVTVTTQPSTPRQVCTVSGGTGTVAAANVTSISVTCAVAGRFAYVANNGLNDIESVSVYSINRTTGLLTPVAGSPFDAGHTPFALAIHPNNKFLYVVDPVGMPINGALTVFSINENTGVLSQIAGSPFAVATGLAQIAIEPAGKFAFAPNFGSPTVSAFALDPGTGAPTLVSAGPFSCVGFAVSVAVDPGGQFVYVGTQGGGPNNGGAICAYAINLSTGALSQVIGSPFPAGGGMVRSLAFNPAGQFLFAAGTDGVDVFRPNASGALTLVAGSPFAAGANPETVAVDPAGKFLYVGNHSLGSGSQIAALSIDAVSGALTAIAGSPFPSGDSPAFIAIDPSGDFAYASNLESNTITVYAVNKTTGALTATGAPIANGADTNPWAIAILK